MLKIIYILLIAVAFTNTFQGATVSFYLKYILSIIWIVLFLMDVARKKKVYRKSLDYWKQFCIPYVLIFFWSIFCFVVNGHLQTQFISRLTGQILYLLITYTCVLATVNFFGKEAIKYSLYAMFLSVLVNLFVTINKYGINSFIEYIKLFLTDISFTRGTVLYSISGSLEVQDITMASGFYIIYYLLFTNVKEKDKKFALVISIICFILGFKRTGLVAILFTLIFYYMFLKNERNLKFKINVSSIMILVASFLYLVVIKFDVLGILETKFNIKTTGRDMIYRNLASFYTLYPWFLGQGYSYVDKVMYDTITFVSHTIIGKMYAEIGFFPFIFWVVHYTNNTTTKIFNKYGKENCMLYLTCCVYMFITFFFENTLTLYCIQFSFMMIPLANGLVKGEYRVKEKNMHYHSM